MLELKNNIANQNCFTASLLLAQYVQSNRLTVEAYEEQISAWATQVKASLPIGKTPSQRLEIFLHFFYINLAFSVDEQHIFTKHYSLVDKVIDFRTGIPITLAIIFQALAKQLGFVTHGVNFPGHFLLSIDLGIDGLVYIDPSNGKKLSLNELECLYFHIMGEVEQETMPPEILLAASCEEVIVHLLHNLKASCINSQQFQFALRTVDLLVALCPNDPYERRDRGFLLHQLECPKVAISDYQYFIEHCPKDPTSEVLAAQVKQLGAQTPAIIH